MYKAEHEKIVTDLFMLPFTAFQGVRQLRSNGEIKISFKDNVPIIECHIKEITKIINQHGKEFSYDIDLDSHEIDNYNLCMYIKIKED